MNPLLLAWMLWLAVIGVGATPACAERIALESSHTNDMLLMMAGVAPLLDEQWENHVVRLRQIWEGPLECGSEPSRCPRQRLAILIMRPNTSTERNLYLLPVSYGWDHPNMVPHHEQTDKKAFILLEIEESVINENAIENNRTTWFKARKRKVYFNFQEAYLDERTDDWVNRSE